MVAAGALAASAVTTAGISRTRARAAERRTARMNGLQNNGCRILQEPLRVGQANLLCRTLAFPQRSRAKGRRRAPPDFLVKLSSFPGSSGSGSARKWSRLVNLSIKHVSEPLVQRLRARAARHHRSLQSELLAIIEAAAREERRLSPVDILAEVRQMRLQTPGEAVQILRADRDRVSLGERLDRTFIQVKSRFRKSLLFVNKKKQKNFGNKRLEYTALSTVHSDLIHQKFFAFFFQKRCFSLSLQAFDLTYYYRA